MGFCSVEVIPSPNVQDQLVGVPEERSWKETTSGSPPVFGFALKSAFSGPPGTGVGEGVGVGVGEAVGVDVGVGVSVGDGVDVGITVGVAVGEKVGVGEAVGMGVGVGVGVGVGGADTVI